jgi:hypothetical protein
MQGNGTAHSQHRPCPPENACRSTLKTGFGSAHFPAYGRHPKKIGASSDISTYGFDLFDKDRVDGLGSGWDLTAEWRNLHVHVIRARAIALDDIGNRNQRPARACTRREPCRQTQSSPSVTSGPWWSRSFAKVALRSAIRDAVTPSARPGAIGPGTTGAFAADRWRHVRGASTPHQSNGAAHVCRAGTLAAADRTVIA